MTNRSAPSRLRWLGFVLLALVSLGAHLLVLPFFARWFVVPPPAGDPPIKVTFLPDDPSMEAAPPAPQDAAAPPDPSAPSQRRRQLVETAATHEVRPDDADYLAEQDNSVDKETRTDRFKINPEVVAPTYSDTSRAPETAPREPSPAASGSEKPATADDVGLSGPGPPRTQIPTRFQPAASAFLPASTRTGAADVAGVGAAQNDLLHEALGDAVALNTLAYPGARYLNQVRRHVNFYWTQKIDNLPPSLALSRPSYQTRVSVVLDRGGALESFRITQPSGDARIDACIQDAFSMSAPFGAPPAELLDPDGRLRLPDFGFTLEIVRVPRP